MYVLTSRRSLPKESWGRHSTGWHHSYTLRACTTDYTLESDKRLIDAIMKTLYRIHTFRTYEWHSLELNELVLVISKLMNGGLSLSTRGVVETMNLVSVNCDLLLLCIAQSLPLQYIDLSFSNCDLLLFCIAQSLPLQYDYD